MDAYFVQFDLVAHFIAEHFEETIFPAVKPNAESNVYYDSMRAPSFRLVYQHTFR